MANSLDNLDGMKPIEYTASSQPVDANYQPKIQTAAEQAIQSGLTVALQKTTGISQGK